MVETLDVKKIVEETKKKMTKAVEATRKEFQNMRTGRASAALVEGVLVDYYDTPTALKAVANISIPDAKTIAIQPWEASIIPNIEKAIMKSGLGLTPVSDGKVVRMQIPSLTQERRDELTRLLKKTAEEGRVSVRNARHEAIEQVKKMEKGKLIPEDMSHSAQKDIQKVTDTFIGQVDEAFKQKETELHNV